MQGQAGGCRSNVMCNLPSLSFPFLVPSVTPCRLVREQGLLETLLEALRCMTDQLLESVVETGREGLGPAEVDVHIFRGQVSESRRESEVPIKALILK